MKLLYTLTLYLALTACVPRAQYDTLVTERNYYRNQRLAADSLAGVALQTSRDSVNLTDRTQRSELRQIEDLTATNRVLEQQLRTFRERYEQLVAQQGKLATTPAPSRSAHWPNYALSSPTSRPPSNVASGSYPPGRPDWPAYLPPRRYRPRGGRKIPWPPPRHRDRLAEELRQVLLAAADTGYTLHQPRRPSRRSPLTLADELLFGASDTPHAGRGSNSCGRCPPRCAPTPGHGYS